MWRGADPAAADEIADNADACRTEAIVARFLVPFAQLDPSYPPAAGTGHNLADSTD